MNVELSCNDKTNNNGDFHSPTNNNGDFCQCLHAIMISKITENR
jgi:hypothetical protein